MQKLSNAQPEYTTPDPGKPYPATPADISVAEGHSSLAPNGGGGSGSGIGWGNPY